MTEYAVTIINMIAENYRDDYCTIAQSQTMYTKNNLKKITCWSKNLRTESLVFKLTHSEKNL